MTPNKIRFAFSVLVFLTLSVIAYGFVKSLGIPSEQQGLGAIIVGIFAALLAVYVYKRTEAEVSTSVEAGGIVFEKMFSKAAGRTGWRAYYPEDPDTILATGFCDEDAFPDEAIDSTLSALEYPYQDIKKTFITGARGRVVVDDVEA